MGGNVSSTHVCALTLKCGIGWLERMVLETLCLIAQETKFELSGELRDFVRICPLAFELK